MQEIIKFSPSDRPSLDADGDVRIVKLTIEGEQYDGMYDKGWWVHYGGETFGFRDIDEYEIEYWSYE